jgi:tRNA G26 N,N-dimethylase Trm1
MRAFLARFLILATGFTAVSCGDDVILRLKIAEPINSKESYSSSSDDNFSEASVCTHAVLLIGPFWKDGTLQDAFSEIMQRNNRTKCLKKIEVRTQYLITFIYDRFCYIVRALPSENCS